MNARVVLNLFQPAKIKKGFMLGLAIFAVGFDQLNVFVIFGFSNLNEHIIRIPLIEEKIYI